MKNTSHQLLIILLAVGSFVTGTSEFVVSGILDMISVDLNISIPAAGQLITVYSLFYAVGALFLVMATSKLNRKKVLLSAIFVFILGNVVAFLSHHFMLLLLSRVITAMSGGLYIVVATNYAAQIAPPEKREVQWRRSLLVLPFHSYLVSLLAHFYQVMWIGTTFFSSLH